MRLKPATLCIQGGPKSKQLPNYQKKIVLSRTKTYKWD